MLDLLIISKPRLEKMLKFFTNSIALPYLGLLVDESCKSVNAVRIEIIRLSESRILEVHPEGNIVMYQANQHHHLFPEISNIVRKYIGFDQIVEVLAKLGKLKLAFLIVDYAEGRDTGIIDLILVGDINTIIFN